LREYQAGSAGLPPLHDAANRSEDAT
jgi:hypothetical protein